MFGSYDWVDEVVSRTVFDAQLVFRSRNGDAHRQLGDPSNTQESCDYSWRSHVRGCITLVEQNPGGILSQEYQHTNDRASCVAETQQVCGVNR